MLIEIGWIVFIINFLSNHARIKFMNNPPLKIEKTPKQISKNEIIYQVFLPLSLALLLFILLAGLVIASNTSGSTDVHQWANISVVFLSIPLIFGFLINLLLYIALIFGLGKLIRWVPLPLKKLHLIFLQIALWLWKASAKLYLPIINIRSNTSAFKKVIFLSRNHQNK